MKSKKSLSLVITAIICSAYNYHHYYYSIIHVLPVDKCIGVFSLRHFLKVVRGSLNPKKHFEI